MSKFYQFVVVFSLILIGCNPPKRIPQPSEVVPQSATEVAPQLATATEAYDLHNKDGKNILFVDVRIESELLEGLPTPVDANVPFAHIVNEKWGFNDDFVPTIERCLKKEGLNKQSRIILICSTGNRSKMAAERLKSVGYKNVYSVKGGVNEWLESDLPSYDPDMDEEEFQRICQ